MSDKSQQSGPAFSFNPHEAVKDLKVSSALLEYHLSLCLDLNISRQYENILKNLLKKAEERRISLQPVKT